MRFKTSIKPEKVFILDAKDRKILNLLAQNARQPYSGIAKKVKLSKDAVRYRLNNLIKSGVIQGFSAVVDIAKLGYTPFHVFLKLNRMDNTIEKRITQIFTAYDFTRAVIRFTGEYDFQLSVVAKGISDFDRILTIIANDCSGYLRDYDILITVKSIKFGALPGEILPYSKIKEKSFVPDKKDIAILREIADNASVPLYTIAKKLSFSLDTVRYRLKKLKEAGILLRFMPALDYSVLGYNVYVVLLSVEGLDSKKELSLKRFLKSENNVLWAIKTVGKYNFMFFVCAKYLNELHSTLNSLRNSFGSNIKSYTVLITYEEYKYTYFPQCIENQLLKK